MRKVLVFLFSFLIGVCLFLWIIEWVGWGEIKKNLFTFSGWEGMVILGITLTIWLMEIWVFKFIFKSQGYNLSARGLGEILFASLSITYLFPTTYLGGETFKVYAIRKKFSLPWKKNLAAAIVEKLLGGSIVLVFLIIGAISFILVSTLPLKNFGIITATFIGGLVLILAVFYFKSFKKESIFKWFFKFFGIRNWENHLLKDTEEEIFHFFDFRKKTMWYGLGLLFLKHFLIFIRCWVLIFFLKGEVNILIPLSITFFFQVAYLFPFPARIGSSEAAQAFGFSSLGLGAATGITFSFILRGAEILFSLLGFIFALKLGTRFLLGDVGDREKIQ